jgi:hypothetical protein
VEKKILLGWKSTKRGPTIPAGQILGAGKVVPGIAQVVAIIGDPELASSFLSQDWPFADKVVRPLDKLKAGKVEEVISAAPSFGTASRDGESLPARARPMDTDVYAIFDRGIGKLASKDAGLLSHHPDLPAVLSTYEIGLLTN